MSGFRQQLEIAGRPVGRGAPCFVIAELSGNHNGDIGRALRLIELAASCGADAVKIQTYTASSLTLDHDQPPFVLDDGTIWDGRTLHSLYEEAATPWDWTEELFAHAAEVGIPIFSTPFDAEAIELLERFDPPAHKIASFEIVDLRLVTAVAATGRPVIMSTGMASLRDIDRAVQAVQDTGNDQLVLLRCNSAYPAPPDEMDLRTMAHMATTWDVPVGLSDHTMDDVAASVATALGACVIEKHFIDDRSVGGPDSSFSLEPAELTATIQRVRAVEASLGRVRYGPSPTEQTSTRARRSLFAVADIASGEVLTDENVRAIRPADGMSPRHRDEIEGRRAAVDIPRGTPLDWHHIGDRP